MALSRENHALTDFSTREGTREKSQIVTGNMPSGHARPQNAKRNGMETGWRVYAIRSYTMSNDIEREKENGRERERERERRIGLVKRFQACRYSGRFSSTLMKPITLRLAKGTPLISAPNISRVLLKPRSVPRHVLVTLDVKAIYLVRYSTRDSHVHV